MINWDQLKIYNNKILIIFLHFKIQIDKKNKITMHILTYKTYSIIKLNKI